MIASERLAEYLRNNGWKRIDFSSDPAMHPILEYKISDTKAFYIEISPSAFWFYESVFGAMPCTMIEEDTSIEDLIRTALESYYHEKQ